MGALAAVVVCASVLSDQGDHKQSKQEDLFCVSRSCCPADYPEFNHAHFLSGVCSAALTGFEKG